MQAISFGSEDEWNGRGEFGVNYEKAKGLSAQSANLENF